MISQSKRGLSIKSREVDEFETVIERLEKPTMPCLKVRLLKHGVSLSKSGPSVEQWSL